MSKKANIKSNLNYTASIWSLHLIHLFSFKKMCLTGSLALVPFVLCRMCGVSWDPRVRVSMNEAQKTVRRTKAGRKTGTRNWQSTREQENNWSERKEIRVRWCWAMNHLLVGLFLSFIFCWALLLGPVLFSKITYRTHLPFLYSLVYPIREF